MLKQVRGSLKKIGAWFIIALLILAFALWGVPELQTFTQRAPLTVGNASFSTQAVQAEYNRQITARRNETGSFDRDDAMAEGLGDQVVSSLVTRTLIEQEAERMGLVVPRALVRDYLQNAEEFQNPATGKFDEFVLQSILSNNQLSVRQFENIIRQQLLAEQLVGSIVMGPAAPRPFTDALIMREIERRQVGYLTITDDMAGVPAEPTPDALLAYYEENKSAFMAPEYRTFSAVTLRSSDFASAAETPEEDLRKIYETNRARLYESPEKRTLYQITYDSESAAQAAVAALGQGKPFENIASEKGFSLAEVTFADVSKSDILDPAVAEAAFASGLAEGEVAGPVKSLFGWTVVQLAGVIPPSTKSFEDVRDEIAAQYSSDDVKKRLFEAIEHIEEARDTGSNLASAAEAAGYKVVAYGPVDASSLAPGGGIIPDLSAEMLAEAFRLQEGDESEAIELPEGDGYFFVQVNAVTAPAVRAFEAVSEEVESRWRADERRTRIEAAVKQVTDAIAGGMTLEQAAEPFNRAVLVAALDRNSRQDSFSPVLLEQVFKADKGAVVSGDAGSGEAQTVVEIRDVGFARSQIGPGEQAAYEQFLSYQLNQEMLEAYITALREDYKVKADDTALAQIFSEGQ